MRKLMYLALLLPMGFSIGCSTAVQEVAPAEEGKEEKAPTMEEMYPPEMRKQMSDGAPTGEAFTGEGIDSNAKAEGAVDEQGNPVKDSGDGDK